MKQSLTRWWSLTRWRLLVCLLAGWLGLVVVARSHGQNPAPPPQRSISGDGNDVLRWVLQQQRWQALASWQEARTDPAQTLLLILGDAGWSSGGPGLPPREVLEFVQAGGALLLASDRPHHVGAAQELRPLGVDIAGAFITVPRGPIYRNVPTWPLAVPLRHPAIPVFANLNQVATNRPSLLRLRPGSPLQYLARFGPSAVLEENRALMVDDYDGHFAAGGFVGQGKALVLADHSVFINSMLWQADNQNLQLTIQALTWLRQPAQPQQPTRTRCLLIDNGRIWPSFDVPITAPSQPVPPIDPAQLLAALLPHANELVRPVDQLIHEVQSPPNDPIGSVNRVIAERFGPLPRNLLLLATVLLVMVGSAWLFNSWRRTITQPGRVESKPQTPGQRVLAGLLPFLVFGFAIALLSTSVLHGEQLIRMLGSFGYSSLVLVGVTLIVAMFFWLARRPAGEIAALSELAVQPNQPPPQLADRLDQLLAQGNLLEALASDLRRRLARLGGDPTEPDLPPVRIAAPWYKRWLIRGRLARLWAISQHRHAGPIRPRDWFYYRTWMTDLEGLAAQGVWRFSTPQETA